MTTFRAAHVTSPGEQLALVDQTLAEPWVGDVLIDALERGFVPPVE